ncbi:MAG TPA: DinB family protein [Acidobacteriota bacterium]|nr:DinB family protein [Acidobacteriota bacterium]
MNFKHHFAQELLKGHELQPWHGPSTKTILAGLTAKEAASHPIEGSHSIWEIVLHIDAWQREVIRRFNADFVPEVPEEGDWRTVLDPTESNWQRTLDNLDSSIQELVRKINMIQESSMEDQRGRTAGGSDSLAGMLSGILQHNAYHSGQIALLLRAIEQARD